MKIKPDWKLWLFAATFILGYIVAVDLIERYQAEQKRFDLCTPQPNQPC
jgi:hypothetical protein